MVGVFVHITLKYFCAFMLLQIFMTLVLLSTYIIINQLAFIGRTIFRYRLPDIYRCQHECEMSPLKEQENRIFDVDKTK